MTAVADNLFIGREAELEQLVQRLERCTESRGGLVMLCGEPGIGKTRTAQRAAEDAARLGFRVCWGRCREEAGAPPFWPWVEVLRALFAQCAHDLVRDAMGTDALDLVPLLPQASGLFPSAVVNHEGPDGAEERFRLFDATARFVACVAEQSPLLIVLDNLHWADRDSLRLLEFPVEGLQSDPVLFIGTYRDSEVSRRHPLLDTLGLLMNEPSRLRMRLRGFDAEDVVEFAETLTDQPPDVALLRSIYSQTEGNPLFVGECCATLRRRNSCNLTRVLGTGARASGFPMASGRRLVAASTGCRVNVTACSPWLRW